MSVRSCQNCGAEVPEGASFCPSCGKGIATRICQSCRAPIPEGSRFCTNCGKAIAAQLCENCGAPVAEGSHLCTNCEREAARKAQEAALQAKKQAEAIARGKARQEAEAAKERAKQEREAARKAQEAALLAKKQAEAIAREKARQEAEAAKERAKQGKEAAQVCAACGAQVPEGAGFCTNCGKKVAAVVPAGKLTGRTGLGIWALAVHSRRLRLALLAVVLIGIAVGTFALIRSRAPAPLAITPQPTVATPTSTPTPTPTPTPTTTPPGTPSLRPFTDDTGSVVNLPEAPKRIVSIGPMITEILVTLGASEKIVGVDDFSYWPSMKASIPRLGQPFVQGDVISPKLGIDTNAIVALHPDLVIANVGSWVRASESVPLGSRVPFPGLDKAGIPAVYLNPVVGVTGAPKLIRSLGAMVGESDKANELVASYEKRKEAVAERVQGLTKVRVLLAQIYRSGPLLMPGILVAQDDRLNELIQLAGGVNVFTSSPEDTAMINKLKELGRTELVLEPFIAKNPEVILVLGALDEMRTGRPGWEKVDAVQKGRVYAIGEMTPLTVIDRLEEISRQLHPVVPTPTPTPTSTAKQYRNSAWGYSIQVFEGWIINDADKAMVVITPQNQGAIVRIRADDQPGITLETTVEKRVSGIRAANPDYQEQSRTQIMLPGGLPAYSIDYTFTRTGIKARALAVITIKGNRGFMVTGGTLANDWGKYSADLQKMEYSLTVD